MRLHSLYGSKLLYYSQSLNLTVTDEVCYHFQVEMSKICHEREGSNSFNTSVIFIISNFNFGHKERGTDFF